MTASPAMPIASAPTISMSTTVQESAVTPVLFAPGNAPLNAPSAEEVHCGDADRDGNAGDHRHDRSPPVAHQHKQHGGDPDRVERLPAHALRGEESRPRRMVDRVEGSPGVEQWRSAGTGLRLPSAALSDQIDALAGRVTNDEPAEPTGHQGSNLDATPLFRRHGYTGTGLKQIVANANAVRPCITTSRRQHSLAPK
jgi:hypothetical protein